MKTEIKDNMHSYLRQWNDAGDYIELPPYPIDEDHILIEVFENYGFSTPIAFKFYKDDLDDLIHWATSMKEQLTDRKD